MSSQVSYLQASGYILDTDLKIWLRSEYAGISYSDGEETEVHIARIIEQADDISVLSTELRRHCTDWPTLYHLSGTRANILRPFATALTGDILEIGAGCGAITRYLGECGANVLALEGSPRRAAITRSRTRDLQNVTVLAEKFDQFQCELQFDVITLIGVLEYANLFIFSENPALTMLKQVRSLLKSGGKLIIAIENQLGLKYFAGAPEDHLGRPMYGIEGRYRADQPQTFGRAVLTNLLEEAGFPAAEFLAPFPDYKLPISILTVEGLSNKRFDGAALAWQSVRRDPQLPPRANFSLELAWPEVFKNGLALEMANSFLIIASPLKQQVVKSGILGYHYSTDRAPPYCKETIFEHTNENTIVVNYHVLSSCKKDKEINEIINFECATSAVYAEGMPLSLELLKIVTREGWSIEEVGIFIKHYINLLSLIADQKGKLVSMSLLTDRLPGYFFDIVPQNIIVNHSGKPLVIDTEWMLNNDIELGFLLFRALLWVLGSPVNGNSTNQAFSRRDFIKSSLHAAGFSISDADFRRFIELESSVQQQVTGRTSKELLYSWAEQMLPIPSMSKYDNGVENFSQNMAERNELLTSLTQALIERDNFKQAHSELYTRVTVIENSTLWKVTLPLRRALTNMPTLRKFCRRSIKLVWWTSTFQLSTRLREWKARKAIGVPHFAPPIDDWSLAVPLSYETEVWKSASPELVVICHMFYPEMANEFQGYLKNIPFPFDLLITTDSQEKRAVIAHHFSQWKQGKIEIRIAPNRGRDIAPKLITCRDAYDKYEFILHIHTKKSPHHAHWGGWRHYLLETLLGSEKIVESVFESFRSDSKLGMISPQHYAPIRNWIGWGWNFENAKKFARAMNINISLNGRIDFPSGSMFWARSAALKPLLNYNLSLDEFPIEDNQDDGTLGHVIERLYFFICERAGYRWMKISRSVPLERMERTKYVENQKELTDFIIGTQSKLLQSRILPQNRSFVGQSRKDASEEQRKLSQLVYEKSDYRHMDFAQFQHELALHIQKKQSLIDFDEEFYLAANADAAISIANNVFSCGFIHYCMVGRDEGRVWSNYQLKRIFSLSSNFPSDFSAPIHFSPLPRHSINLSNLPKNPAPLLLILISHLQDDLFFAGYTAFFRDFGPIFGKFSKVIVSIESEKYNSHLATQYSDRIEVIHERKLRELKFRPDLIVAFNSQLFIKAKQIFNNSTKTIYYCQDFESGFFPYSAEYVEAAKVIADTQNIIVSTELLRKFLVNRQLLSNQRIYTTSPKIEPFDVPQEKTKRLFFYFRPESFHRRNLPETLMEAVQDFCNKHTGYEIYMIGSVDTRLSYKINNTPVYVISKLPKKEYLHLISSSDVVISMIYSAHPGVIAFQAAASGIPTVTNVFENRNALLLKQISENILPYDPVRENLLEVIEEALNMPKGNKSFNEELYSGSNIQTLDDFIDTVLSSE